MNRAFVLGGLTLAAALSAGAAVEIPKSVSTCTNFTTCAQNVRNDFSATARKCAQAGDMAGFGRLMDALAKERMSDRVFDLWLKAANDLVAVGQEQSRKKPAVQTAVMAGFREGGTTFGLWQGAEEIGKTPGQAYTSAAANLLRRKLPEKGLSAAQRVMRDCEILAIQNRAGTESGKTEAAESVRAHVFALRPSTPAESNVFWKAVNASAAFALDRGKNAEYAAFAKEFRTKCADMLKKRAAGEWMARELGGYARVPDEARYRALKAEFLKRPVDGDFLAAVLAFRDTVVRPWTPPLWPNVAEVAAPLFAARGRFAGNDRLQIDDLAFRIADAAGDIDGLRRAYADLLATAAGMKKEDRPNLGLCNQDRTAFVRRMNEIGDYAAVVPELEKTYDPRNVYGSWDLAVACVRAGRGERAVQVCEALVTNKQVTADMAADARALRAWVQAKDEKDLVAKLAATRGDRDDKAWFNALRRAGRLYFTIDSTERRVTWLKAVVDASRALLWPEEKVEYTLVWMPDAPKSADSALRGDVFSKLKRENRLGTYSTWNAFSKNNELARLKSQPAPHTAADAEGKEGCVVACYDAAGLHFYAKFNDPEAWKARDGLANGFYVEYDFQPGGEAPWHWNMITRADAMNVDQGAVWDSPRKGFKVGAEYIREDAVSTDTCHVFHLFVPWILCWNEFPMDGDVWRLVFVAGWAGQFGSLGGSNVHELGRGLHMRFDLPEAARKTMLRTLLRQAVKDYRLVRDKWENAAFWSDPDLGDPAFDKEVAAPFVAACDALAKECSDPALSDARAAEICATRLWDIADFRLALDQKRADYLKAKFFEK